MKFFKLMMIALLAMLGFVACDRKIVHINDDHGADLAGTWTCLTENYAEVLIIKADGSAVSYGVEDGEYWENVKGTVTVSENNIVMNFEDDDNLTGHFDIIPGMAFSLFEDSGERFIYQYCENDLSDEILGMWVCNDGPSDKETDMVIQTFKEDGTVTKSGWSVASNEFIVNETINYKVVGDLIFHQRPSDMVSEGVASHFASKLTYMPNANQLGDMLTNTAIKVVNGEVLDLSMSMLRVKQSLNLTGNKYAYKSAYVTNAKGNDEDFTILGKTFNMANIAAADFDVVFGADLYMVELKGNSITHKFRPDGQDLEVVTPITVEGNKVTLDYSAVNPACRKVEMYMFQDQDNTQLHMYMHTNSFVNYFANLGIPGLIAEGKLDPTDTAAVEKVFADMESRVESINASFVFKARK
jgi:hypothetical protein